MSGNAIWNFMIAIQFYLTAWWLTAPLAIAAWLIYLPFGLLQKLIIGTKKEPEQARQIEVEVVEAKNNQHKPKDELLFIHGFPDSKDLWKKQIPKLSEDYRCILITLPFFSGKHHISNSWGVPLKELSQGLAKVVEKHSIKKKVTLIIHDWGSPIGFWFRRDRPDLVSRIATLDIGGESEPNITYMILSLSYQLLFCLLFALGEPFSTFFVKFFFKVATHQAFGPLPRPEAEVTGSMMYPYWQFWMNHMFKAKDPYLGDLLKQNRLHDLEIRRESPSSPYQFKIPIFFAYGRDKAVMFHSQKWCQKMEQAKGCEVRSFDCKHWLMHEKPDELNQCLVKWLQDTQSDNK